VVEQVLFYDEAGAVVASVRPRKGAPRCCGVCSRRCGWEGRGERDGARGPPISVWLRPTSKPTGRGCVVASARSLGNSGAICLPGSSPSSPHQLFRAPGSRARQAHQLLGKALESRRLGTCTGSSRASSPIANRSVAPRRVARDRMWGRSWRVRPSLPRVRHVFQGDWSRLARSRRFRSSEPMRAFGL